MGKYDCKCGESFQTLTKYRLHQGDDCPLREVLGVEDDLGVDAGDVDGLTDEIVRELMTCEFCETVSDGLSGVETMMTDGGPSITGKFTCTQCGGENENTAFIPYE